MAKTTQLNHKAALKRVEVLTEANRQLTELVKTSNDTAERCLQKQQDMLEETAFNRQSAIDWKERSQKVEKDNANLERERDMLKERIRMIEDNNNRLLGWVDAKLGRQPQLESEVPF